MKVSGLCFDMQDTHPLHIEPVATIRANLARYSGDLERALTLAREALDLLPEKQVMMRVTATVMGLKEKTYGIYSL